MLLKDVNIITNVKVCNNYYLMSVMADDIAKFSQPGQFFMIKCRDSSKILRRPISIHNINNNKIEFYYEVLGKGTKEFSQLSSDDKINIQGPLGSGFDDKIKNKNVVVVGGGMGMAPLKYLIKNLYKTNNITLIAGGRDADALYIIKEFTFPNIKIVLATDNGSLGVKGSSVDVLKTLLVNNKTDIIYTCGPYSMMKAVIEIAKNEGIRCQVSLEERMACGVKACVGCSILTKNGIKKVCHDGPIFEGRDILD